MPNNAVAPDVDLVVVGAGFSGLYLIHRARLAGMTVRGVERGSGVGGTWFWNTYPGARCDAESIYYSYSFSPELQNEWRWSERFATQPEILAYLEYVADRFDLRRSITFDREVKGATFDEVSSTWRVRLNDGTTITSRFVIMGTGNLSESRVPKLTGLDDFSGQVLHTGTWPEAGVDLADKRVAVIGTGSSGIQCIPLIAAQAKHLTVLQRTPTFSVPARNTPISDEEYEQVRAVYPALRAESLSASGAGAPSFGTGSAMDATPEERLKAFQVQWDRGGPQIGKTYDDLMVNSESNDAFSDFLRSKIHEIVDDPATAAQLTPRGFPAGSKRLCVDTNYYETFNRNNVTLLDVAGDAIRTITATGVELESGRHVEVDVLIFATGYDAMTGALLRIDIQGRQGIKIQDAWAYGPRTYLGLAIADFPNLFIVTGPGSPSVLTNMATAIEQHVDWIIDHLRFVLDRGASTTEPERAAQDAWVEHVNQTAEQTLFTKGRSWYVGANVPGKPHVFMPYVGGFGRYREHCDLVAAAGYDGFTIASAEERA